MSTTDATLLPNDTYAANSGTTSHIGQLFFDQNLITEMASASAKPPSTTDPFVDYLRLGDSLGDGFLTFITIFVDRAID
ncbi:hypothetical protein F5B18DRAFT_651987 [Nemania serpens]|nr:hypothetical protein F5B18DRAFT_651987 [Nemania serpens]